ncbi:hypothetical protein Ae201684_002550 [Aphanomyces euteiches]|uniref:Uncharacterized protein n=1 Tax=Aphanomyces euteiches TaxID=100861 RepID=A0A6G0XQ80_9STRA|nr:hypothetical protein Ae201684_002550 [Aphanomyces euteiches]
MHLYLPSDQSVSKFSRFMKDTHQVTKDLDYASDPSMQSVSITAVFRLDVGQRQTNLVVLELMDESLFCLKERSRQNSKNHNNGGFKTIQEYAHSALSLSYKCGNKLESELPADGDWRQLGRAWNRDEPYFVSVYWQLS